MKNKNDFTTITFVVATVMTMALMQYVWPYYNLASKNEIRGLNEKIALYQNEYDEKCECEECAEVIECEECNNDVEYIPYEDTGKLEQCNDDMGLIELALNNCRDENNNLMKKNTDIQDYADEVYGLLEDCLDKYPW